MAMTTYNITWQCSQPLSTRRAPITQMTFAAALTSEQVTSLVADLNALSLAQVSGITQQVYQNKVLPSSLPDPSGGENTSFLFRGYDTNGQRVSVSVWIPAKKETVEEADIKTIATTYNMVAKSGSPVEYAGQREGRQLA